MVSKSEKLRVLINFRKGFDLYMKKQFDEATKYFKICLEIDPNDGPSKTFLERCEEYLKNPPPEDWDGVYEMKTK